MRYLCFVFIFLDFKSLCQVGPTHKPKAKQIKIEGIGFIKIDKSTTALIDSISKQNNVGVRVTYKVLDLIIDLKNPEGFLKYIYELKKDTTAYGFNDDHAIMQDNVRVFYLNFLNISGVDIRNIYLKFYKDTLFEFSCESAVHNSELSIGEAFKEKYGKPSEDKVTKKPVVCENGFGAIFNYESYEHYSLWFPKNIITAEEFLSLSYDDCKPFSFYYFNIKDQVKNKKIFSNEIKFADSEKDSKKKKFIKNMKSF